MSNSKVNFGQRLFVCVSDEFLLEPRGMRKGPILFHSGMKAAHFD